MKILLDTHAFIWFVENQQIVSRDEIFDNYNINRVWK